MRDTEMVDHIRISDFSSLPSEMAAQIEHHMVGNRTCSLQNMEHTCFAAEYCALASGFPMRDELTSRAPLTLVAHTSSENEFVGCVSVGPVTMYPPSYFPKDVYTSHSDVIYNLCVSKEYQGRGVGRQLVDAVRQRVDNKSIYLLVLKKGRDSPMADVARVMTSRVQRLDATYTRMGLRRVDNMSDVVVYQVA